MYKQTQKLYTDLAKRSARGLRVVAPGYGVAQLQLVDLALRCCARGELLSATHPNVFTMHHCVL